VGSTDTAVHTTGFFTCAAGTKAGTGSQAAGAKAANGTTSTTCAWCTKKSAPLVAFIRHRCRNNGGCRHRFGLRCPRQTGRLNPLAMETFLHLLIPLTFTVLIESGIAFLCGEYRLRFYLAMLCINTLTNLPLNVFLGFCYGYGIPCIWTIIGICEVLVVVAEWYLLLFIFPKEKKRMCLYALVMNVGSFFIGLGIYRMLGL
jgi:hypothetical protein